MFPRWGSMIMSNYEYLPGPLSLSSVLTPAETDCVTLEAVLETAVFTLAALLERALPDFLA